MYFEVNSLKTYCSNGSGKLDPSQKSVVFIHGAGIDHTTFVLASRYFARQNYNVYAIDLPAHGNSSGDPLDSIKMMSDWLYIALNQLGVENTALVGHSMGSLISLQFASDHSKMLRSMVLVGTSIPMPVSDPLLNAAKENSHDAFDMANTWSHSKAAQLGGNENPGINMMMSGQRLYERSKTNVLYADLNACNNFTNSKELARNIVTETLIIVGDQDQMTTPVKALEVANTIPDCRTLRLNPCGHAMFAEQPNAVLDGLISIV